MPTYPLKLTERDIQRENRLQMAWIRTITHVCSTWRDLALDSPSLWTQIKVNSRRDIVLEMLQRSRTLPLTISLMYMGDAGGVLGLIDSIIDDPVHHQRIKHLELGMAYYCYQWILPKFASGSSPANLESCSLSTTAGSSGNLFTPTMIPIVLLQNSSHTLRDLQVSECIFDFQGITGTVSLPNLSNLVLGGSVREVTPLLNRLCFPPTCSIELNASWRIDEAQSYELGQAVQRIWRGWNFQAFDVTVSMLKFGILGGEGSTSNLVIRQYYKDTANFQKWFDAFPVEHLQTLRVGSPLAPGVWRHLAQRCPNILSFALAGAKADLVYGLRNVLYLHDQGDLSSSNQGIDNEFDVPFKSRAFLNLERLECDVHSDGDDLEESLHSALLDTIEQRHELGIQIKHLALPGIATKGLEDLAPYVGKIVGADGR